VSRSDHRGPVRGQRDAQPPAPVGQVDVQQAASRHIAPSRFVHYHDSEAVQRGGHLLAAAHTADHPQFAVAALLQAQEFVAACVDIAEIAAARNPGVVSFEGVALTLRGRRDKDLALIAQSADVLARGPRPVLRGL